MKPILVVGATGLLGSEVVARLCQGERRVRAAVRGTSNGATRQLLVDSGAECVAMDLKDEVSVVSACRDARVVVSTASATVSRQDGDSIQTVDDEGHLRLIDAAVSARVEHFVFVSFPPVPIDFALQRAKRKVEEYLRSSGLRFTILQPVSFIEVWLGPALGFDPVNGVARILGTGEKPTNWISYRDVARFVKASALASPEASGTTVPLGGPEALSPLDVMRLFVRAGVIDVKVEHVPESFLETQLAGARDAIEEAYGALMLTTARGQVARQAPELPGEPLRTVGAYANEMWHHKNNVT